MLLPYRAKGGIPRPELTPLYHPRPARAMAHLTQTNEKRAQEPDIARASATLCQLCTSLL